MASTKTPFARSMMSGNEVRAGISPFMSSQWMIRKGARSLANRKAWENGKNRKIEEEKAKREKLRIKNAKAKK